MEKCPVCQAEAEKIERGIFDGCALKVYTWMV